MLVVPLRAIPNQQAQAQLDGQAVSLNVYQTAYGLFMDVTSDDVPVIDGVICQNLNRIVRDAYLGFVGDFVFVDTQAASPGLASDPDYTGLGDATARFQLIYLEAADL